MNKSLRRLACSRARRFYLYLLIGVAVVVCATDTGSSPAAAFRGLPNVFRYLGSMWPPNLAKIPVVMPDLLETVEVAVVAITGATVAALFLGLLGAKNINRCNWLHQAARMLLNFLRGIPALLYALIFVSMVGLGPFPGVLGLTCAVTGALGRYFAEAFEGVDPGLLEAGQGVGAPRVIIILWFVIPDVIPLLAGYTMYYFEYCVRTSTLLGLVGAGGIGVPLLVAIRLFRGPDVSAILLLILTVVFFMDRLSALVRHKILRTKKVL